ncbi:MAG TPA: thiamine pyrophosphate-binding protein, partial [Polyangiales bacterium]|nr:thiamine pyrophosphate-binding protein [Polyangiales bacterium]
MKVSDYLVSRLADAGVSHVFMLTGGGAMHLNDSFGKEPRMRYVCNHHEQACAMAAEGYARIAGRPAAVNVTTGPGGLNALNGVWGAYTDSLPMIVLSGQVKRETCMSTYPGMALRQLGDQEVDIVRIASAITKYAVMLREPNRARYEIEKAIHLATTGRPGPVWIDVPIDVQASTIDPDELEPYMPPPPAAADAARLRAQCDDLVARIRKAERPAILLGSGIRVGHAEAELERVIRKLQIPVTTSWTAIDLLGSDDPLYCGRPGSVGDRPGNFTIQNSDLVITLGSRLPIRQVSYNFAAFAHHAFKVQVDIDPAELEKPYGKPDLGIVADLREFLIALDANLGAAQPDPRHAKWLAWCKERLARYPVVLPKHSAPAKLINPYHFS